MPNNAENEKIINLQRMIANHKAAKDKGVGSGYSEEIITSAKEDLYCLTTSPQQRIADAEASIKYVIKHHVVGFNGLDSGASLDRLRRDIDRAKREITGEKFPSKKQLFPSTTGSSVSPPQGDTRRPRTPLDGSQHTGTEPYFDTNSDHMRQIDPLAPHYDLSGDFPKLVTPLKPGPKMPTNG